MEIPGPIVVDRVIFFKYTPFAEAGFAFFRSPTKASKFLFDLPNVETYLADAAVHNTRLIGTELHLTRFGVFHGGLNIRCHCPGLGVGHKPRGPNVA